MFLKKFLKSNELVKLGSLCEIIIGLTYRPENVCNDGIIVLRSGNIQKNSIQTEFDIVKVQNIVIPLKKNVRMGDIIMCSRNGSPSLVGKSAILKKEYQNMTFGAFMSCIRSRTPYVLQSFFETDLFRQQLGGTQTSSVNQITSLMLANIDIFTVKEDEEFIFMNLVKQVDKLKFIVNSSVILLKNLLSVLKYLWW